MGLFDFLHGVQNQKSEAEIYMEQRNKEYARKAAAYKRRDAMVGLSESIGFTGRSSDQDKRAYTKQRINTAYQNAYKPSETSYSCQSKPSTTFVQKTTQTVRRPSNNSCDDCGKSRSIYDEEYLNIFEIENAFAKSATRTVTASGIISRGNFQVGDKVELNTTIESRAVTIQQMFRQGEQIPYANSSSGKIAIVLSNAADVLVRKGDTIKKKK